MQETSDAHGAAVPPALHSSTYDAAPVRLIDIGHSRIAYRTFGHGPDLLFIHGWPLHAATFRAIAPKLAQHFRCHLFDLPGAGATEITQASPLDLESHIESTRRVIKALSLERYAIVAHDSGGLVARAIAAEDARVFALVLGDTEIPSHTPKLIRQLHTVLNLPLGRFALFHGMRLRSARRYAHRGVFENLDYIDGEFHDLFVAPLLQSRARSDAAFELVRGLDHTLVDKLPALHQRIAADVLLIWGERDRIFPLELARQMVPQFRRARIEVLPGGKTFVHEEQPAAFSALAEAHLLRALAERATAAAE